jgi:hypothetical protein
MEYTIDAYLDPSNVIKSSLAFQVNKLLEFQDTSGIPVDHLQQSVSDFLRVGRVQIVTAPLDEVQRRLLGRGEQLDLLLRDLRPKWNVSRPLGLG